MSGEFDTPPVNAHNVEDVFNEFISHLDEIESIDNTNTCPLGSTRSILGGSDSAPDQAGDIDMVVLARYQQDVLSDVLGDLYDHFEGSGLSHKHFFKNIFSIAFENEITDEPVQVDLVISERDPGRKMYRYLRDLKYFSSPDSSTNLGFKVKGLHRTELIRSFARVHGLSMATKGFSAYVWAPKHETYSDLMERLEDKYSRTRSEENLDMLEKLMEHLRNQFSSLSSIRNELFGVSPFLKRKYLINRAGVGPVAGKYAAKTLERELTNMKSLEHLDWECVLKKFMGLNGNNLLSFRDAYHHISALQTPEPRTRHAALDYKAKLSNDGYWNEDLQNVIETSFSVELD